MGLSGVGVARRAGIEVGCYEKYDFVFGVLHVDILCGWLGRVLSMEG